MNNFETLLRNQPIMNLEKLESRWEYGSEIHWPSVNEFQTLCGEKSIKSIYPNGVMHGTGCSTIRTILNHGRLHRGWRKIWVPTYFIQEVTAVIAESGLIVKYYQDNPLLNPPGLPSGERSSDEVVFRMNYFGWRGAEAILSPKELGCDIIEDHCHDLIGNWAQKSQATYCLSTLRKLYPVPDGAILWSPLGAELPEEPETTTSHLCAVQKKLSGMLMKSFYLSGGQVSKSEFRKAAIVGENEIGGKSGISGVSDMSRQFLSSLSVTKLSQCRAENFEIFRKLAPLSVSNYLAREKFATGCYPFSIVFLFDTENQRDRIRDHLIKNRIYPAIFWDLPVDLDDSLGLDFASRMLAIPCDFRYKIADLQRMAVTLEQAIAACH